MDLDIQRCPRCHRILSGGACAFCANATQGGSLSSMPPARSQHPPSMAPGPRSQHPPSMPPDEARLRTAAARIASLRPPEVRRSPWWGRLGALLVVAIIGTLGWVVFGDRPAWRGLATTVDGPEPSQAKTVLFFLHGHGGSNGDVAWITKPLRTAGVSPDTAIVFVEAPYASGFGRQWGEDGGQRAIARERIRAAITKTLGTATTDRRVVIGGFSQGAQLAADVAFEEPDIESVILLSPCIAMAPTRFREGVGVLIAHGTQDRTCKVERSTETATVLEHAKLDVTFVTFEEGHVIAPEAIDAVAKLLAPAPG
jgi:predicted esterase